MQRQTIDSETSLTEGLCGRCRWNLSGWNSRPRFATPHARRQGQPPAMA